MSIVELSDVNKQFRLGQGAGALSRIKHLFSSKPKTNTPRLLGALNDLNLSINPGEVVGIIGQNGAGKSTLLKLLAKVIEPTTGTVSIKGSVAPMIELGAGFHGELSGRENIFLNGSILGVPRRQLKRQLDEIVAFAELESFIDTPVKRYSSGMVIRLGFAIATSVESDILLIDEVLAVGDLAFQRKCFDRMEDIISEKRKTIILVSHNIRQVHRLCSRAILLDQGCIVVDGDPDEVTEQYYSRSNQKIISAMEGQTARNIHSSGDIELISVDLLAADGECVNEVTADRKLRVRIEFLAKKTLSEIEVVVGTHRTDFVYLTAGSSVSLGVRPSFAEGKHTVEYSIDNLPLIHGTYCVRVAFFDRNRSVIFSAETLTMFTVSALDGEASKPRNRTLDLPFSMVIDEQQYFSTESSLAADSREH